MSLIVENLIPRLKKFAQKTELKEALVDKVWVIYDDNDLIECEFDRFGGVSVTKNGNYSKGAWKIAGSGRLIIDADFSYKILEYDFCIKGILVLKFSGIENKPLLLLDPRHIENGNVMLYLQTLEKSEKEDRGDGDIVVFWIGFLIVILICLSIAFGKDS